MTDIGGAGTRAALPLLVAVVVLTLRAAPVPAQALYAYPLAGQSPEQQSRDAVDCRRWASQQTGFDPNRPPPRVEAYYTPPPQQSGGFGSGTAGQGGMMGDAARGAALGAIGGAIAGDAGEGAAIGAASGALFGAIRRSQRQQQEQQWYAQQQAQAAQQQRQLDQQYRQAQANFGRAYGACMSARKYQVQ